MLIVLNLFKALYLVIVNLMISKFLSLCAAVVNCNLMLHKGVDNLMGYCCNSYLKLPYPKTS